MSNQKKSLDDWLKSVDYAYLNSNKYEPSVFALQFVNFIKLVNGAQGESNKTPPMHLKMLDTITYRKRNHLVNLCFRGSGKALALDTPILTTEGWKTIQTLNIGDYVYGIDGKPTKVIVKSNVFSKPMYRLFLADNRTLDVSEDHINVIIHRKGFNRKNFKGTKCVYEEITTKELLNIKLKTTRTKTKKNPKGQETMVWIPKPAPLEFSKKNLPIEPYTLGLLLGDGNIHRKTGYSRLIGAKDDITFYKEQIPYELGVESYDKRNPNVHMLGIRHIGKLIKRLELNVHGDYKFIPKDYLYSSIEDRLAILQGLMDTDGTIGVDRRTPSFSSNSEVLAQGVLFICYSLGGSGSIKTKITASGKTHYRVNLNLPFCPFRLPRKLKYFKPTYFKDKVPLEKIEKIPTVLSQCIAVDNPSHTYLAGDLIPTHNTSIFGEYMVLYLAVFNELPDLKDISGMMYIADTMENGAKSLRKNIEYRYNHSEFLQSVLPRESAKFTDNYLEFTNIKGNSFGVKLFGATTGLRGTKIFGKRPSICVLDDLISDESAKSKTVMDLIKDTVYKGVDPALDPNGSLVILSGTPFNKEDIILEAVESGAWETNVYPICERFPCTRDEFQGAWEDRFTYDFIKESYERYKLSGKLGAFYQELMLQITSDEDRMVLDSEIRWYKRSDLLKKKYSFNFYITTDFATSSKTTADFSVISVWAVNGNEDWYWVDGIVAKQSMDKTIDDLFRLVQKYKPIQVGIEITGQQGAFISLLQREMMNRSIWFNFASSDKTGNTPGIRPTTDKLSRFNYVLPKFKAGKMYFPEEARDGREMTEFMLELKLATYAGFKGHDDCIDTISQLTYLKVILPSSDIGGNLDSSGIWDDTSYMEDTLGMDNYIV